MNYIDIIGLTAALCTSISFLPQAIKTIKTKDTSGISLFMYSLFTFGTVLWLTYGILSHGIPVIVANAITLSLSIVILTYKIRYK